MRSSYSIAQHFTTPEFIILGWRSLFNIKMIRIIFIFVISLSVMSSLLSILTTNNSYFGALAEMLMPALLLPLLFLVLMTVSSLLTSLMRPQLIRGNTLHFTQQGIQRTGIGPEYSIPWADFSKMIETKSYLILLQKGKPQIAGQYIQKRMFSTEAEIKEFKNFCDSFLPLY